MKTKDLFEGIQRRTKQDVPRVIKYRDMFFAAVNGWTKRGVIGDMADSIHEAKYLRDKYLSLGKRLTGWDLEVYETWNHLIDKKLHPNDISDADMEQFVLDWESASEQTGDIRYELQNKALRELARKL